MFEFLFKYPGAVFQKGQFVLLASWPVWILALGVIAAGGCCSGTCGATAVRSPARARW